MKVPFSVYDFFAYLSAGVVVLVSLDVGVGEGRVLTSEMTVTLSAVVLVAAYVVGQLIAQVSAMILEAGVVAGLLGRPSETLFRNAPSRFRFLFPGYFRALPSATQERVKATSKARGFSGDGEALFLHAYGVVTRDPVAQERLDSFRNLYGFARNMTVALALAAGITAYGILGLGRAIPSWVPVASAIAAVGMLYRYLKFFRQYSYQLLVMYAEATQGQGR